MTPTSQKLIAIYGTQLLDDLVAIEDECREAGLVARLNDLEATDFTYRDEDPMKPAKRETYVRLDAVLALLAEDKAEAPSTIPAPFPMTAQEAADLFGDKAEAPE